MNALPTHGTYRSFTDEELERLGVPVACVEGFMRCVIVSLLGERSFYPRAYTVYEDPYADQ